MPFVTMPAEKGENNAPTWGNTRTHVSDDITRPSPRPGRETFVPAKCAGTHAGKAVAFPEAMSTKDRASRARKGISQNDELKIYHVRMRRRTRRGGLLFSTRNRTRLLFRYVDPVFLRLYPSLFFPSPSPQPFLFLSFSFYLFLFTFLAAPLPYKLISRLPRTDGAEQLNSLFPFTYPFVSTFTFIFE